MTEPPLPPLRFEPILQYRLWGGRRLADWLDMPLPGDGPVGEAWLLSDRDEFPSRVADGPFKGRTIGQLIAQAPDQVLGDLASRFRRFPLLLKYLDVARMLSVQVHPRDGQADAIPAGETGKTEAWVVLQAGPHARLYAGLKPGTTAADLRALSARTADGHLAHFAPQEGQCVLIEAGTVHAVGDGVLLFEVQQNSDVTYRLYDWEHVDPKTGAARPLQVAQALACVDWGQVPVRPFAPVVEATQPALRERIVECRQFRMWRLSGAAPFTVGAAAAPRVVVCIGGRGHIEHDGDDVALARGGVVLLPASAGLCRFRPDGPVTVLEIGVPDDA